MFYIYVLSKGGVLIIKSLWDITITKMVVTITKMVINYNKNGY